MRPDASALDDGSGHWTWRELLTDASALAERLGPVAGQRVALLANDTGAAVVAIHAVRLAQATLVPLHRRLTEPELAALVARAGATSLLHDAAFGSLAGAVAGGVTTLELRGHGTRQVATPPSSMDPGAMGAMVFTSGTTGAPKGALLTIGALLASARSWNELLGARPDDHWLAALPLSHVAGLGIVLRSVCSGARLTVQERFEPAAVQEALATGGISHLSLVPTQLRRLLDAGPIVAPSLRGLLLGGAPIPVTLVQRALAAGLPVIPTYGLTEAASGVTASPTQEAIDHPWSAGRPLPGMRIRVVEPGGTDAPPGSVGEILVSGATLFSGYDRDPEATAAALQDGWLRTGDLGSTDAAGRLAVVDRRDDLIVSGGENISPVEVEMVLAAHPDVADVAVVARPDPVWGAVPVAAVVPRTPLTPGDTDGMLVWARQRLAGFKVPARIQVVDAIPRTPSGKVIRGEVSRLVASSATDLWVDRPDGARIHVRRRGDGPLMVLLHATLSNAQELDPLAVTLAEHASILAVDRRSAGASSMPTDDVLGPLDVAVHIDDIVAVLDALAPGAAPLVVGHSYGACVGLELAARHPRRTVGAWLFEPPYLSVGPTESSAGSRALGERITDIARRDGLPAAALAFLETVNGPGISRRLPPDVLAQFEREGRSAVADSALAGMRPEGLDEMAVPVEVGLGGRSRGPYEAVATGLARHITALDVMRFPTLGHGGPISQPGVVGDAILSFAERIGHLAPLAPRSGDPS